MQIFGMNGCTFDHKCSDAILRLRYSMMNNRKPGMNIG